MTISSTAVARPTNKVLPVKKRNYAYKLSLVGKTKVVASRSMPGNATSSVQARRHLAKRRVHFSKEKPSVRTRSVTKEDLCNSWYKSSQYREFERDNRDTLALWAAGADVELYDCTLIGLEHYAGGRNSMIDRRMTTMNHVTVVLKSYDLQRHHGLDSDVVRSVSEQFSEQPVLRALLRATPYRL